ncbi:isoprenylcysteine carboxylmethyltransferase family protein [Dyella solisilvae]|uniref:Isoprenylcysteine carboxylmethyltransferase family protein n=1 Tax=Dyella solisilvae TaxID=1920168 RepID=A0A370K2D7_9GAMM|nr:isoprenylcysteine carboxylmethyltransferase family protein [Dyella solisilvae]RDI96809.1 isoprenylcysteine carboxylmethyltransferase family protein [Dyella solisilvae]
MNMVRGIALVVFFLWLTIDALVVFRLKTSDAENRDHFSLKLLMIGNPLVYAASIGLSYGTTGAFHSIALQLAGLVILIAGIAIRSLAIAQLGRLHTPNVAVRSDHQLKENGLYGYVRHPSYLGALIAFFGFAMALGNWLSVVVMSSLTTWIYLYRIREEEAALSAAFGEAFQHYASRTKRLIPWVY